LIITVNSTFFYSTIHPYGVKRALGGNLVLPTMHPYGVKYNSTAFQFVPHLRGEIQFNSLSIRSTFSIYGKQMYIACRIKTNIRHQPIILQRYNVAANKPISGINQSPHRGALLVEKPGLLAPPTHPVVIPI